MHHPVSIQSRLRLKHHTAAFSRAHEMVRFVVLPQSLLVREVSPRADEADSVGGAAVLHQCRVVVEELAAAGEGASWVARGAIRSQFAAVLFVLLLCEERVVRRKNLEGKKILVSYSKDA